MSIVAEFTIPPDAIPGRTVLENVPDVRIEVESVVPSDDAVLPFFWVLGAEPERVLDLVRTEPEIADVRVLTEVDHAALFRATWSADAGVIAGIETLQATIMEATGTADEWWFRVRAENRDRLDEFRCHFHEQSIPIELQRIYDLSRLADLERPLTSEQRRTLTVAYRHGYYDEPRQITQAELGDHFGISA